jgi:hypothetical protein
MISKPYHRTPRRREFLLGTAVAIAATSGISRQLVAASPVDPTRVPLGFDGQAS